MSRIRVSAEIGSANSTRSTRVRRANSMMSSTLPSFGAPAQVSSARLSLRSSNTPSMSISESDCTRSVSTSFSPFWSEPTMMVRRSSLPSRAQLRTIARSNSRSVINAGETHEEERREPEPRDLAAELGEERRADEQQEHERPGRDHPRHLPELAAKHLHFIDVGGLEADHRGGAYAEDGCDIFPAEDPRAAPHRPDTARRRRCSTARNRRAEPRRRSRSANRPGGLSG